MRSAAAGITGTISPPCSVVFVDCTRQKMAGMSSTTTKNSHASVHLSALLRTTTSLSDTTSTTAISSKTAHELLKMQCSTLKSIAFWALVLSVQAIVPETVKNVHEKHVAHARAARRVPRVRVCWSTTVRKAQMCRRDDCHSG